MRKLVGIFIILLVIVGSLKLYEYWEKVDAEKELKEKAIDGSSLDGRGLPGLPYQLEPMLIEAQKQTSTFKEWLEMHKKSRTIKDPRLAWIELDYLVLVARENPVEAKKVFAEVKKRVPKDSPVYPRIKALEKTYE